MAQILLNGKRPSYYLNDKWARNCLGLNDKTPKKKLPKAKEPNAVRETYPGPLLRGVANVSFPFCLGFSYDYDCYQGALNDWKK